MREKSRTGLGGQRFLREMHSADKTSWLTSRWRRDGGEEATHPSRQGRLLGILTFSWSPHPLNPRKGSSRVPSP